MVTFTATGRPASRVTDEQGDEGVSAPGVDRKDLAAAGAAGGLGFLGDGVGGLVDRHHLRRGGDEA